MDWPHTAADPARHTAGRVRLEDLSQSDINLLRVAGGSAGAGLHLPSGIVIPDEDTWQCLLLEAREAYGW
jgi:hypothetical protein